MKILRDVIACSALAAAATGAGMAAAGHWLPATTDGAREIDLETIAADRWPLVRYRYRLRVAPAAAGKVSLQAQAAEVDCQRALRRPLQGELPADAFVALDSLAAGEREEFVFICDLARPRDAVGRRVPHSTPAPAGASPASAVEGQAPRRGGRVALDNGSGFLVQPRFALTNHHVVKGCTTISVRRGANTAVATLANASERHDLALLRLPAPVGNAAAIRIMAALGEDAMVAGYPLSGLLADDLVVTSGQVNSLAGLGNDPQVLQISAPVQPGNSGGPLVDRSGSVVGMVVGKLDAARVARETGDLPQNVNFAIKPEVLRAFLDSSGVSYQAVGLDIRLDGIQIAERARQFTVQVICEH